MNLQDQKLQEEAAQWFDNNFDCYADSESIQPAITKEKFLSFATSRQDEIDRLQVENENRNRFIEWIATKDEWHFDNKENLWRQDGYKSRTTQELFEYFLALTPPLVSGEGK